MPGSSAFQGSDFRQEFLQPLERGRVRRLQLLRPQRHPQLLQHPAQFFELRAAHTTRTVGDQSRLVGLPVARELLLPIGIALRV